jgi:hypothetical protein
VIIVEVSLEAPVIHPQRRRSTIDVTTHNDQYILGPMRITFVASGHYNVRIRALASKENERPVDANIGTLWSERAQSAFEILREHVSSGEEMSAVGLALLMKQIETGEQVDDDEDPNDE